MTNKSKYHNRHLFQIFSLQTKMVLIITTILIILPAVAFFIIEMNNPHTLGPMNIFDKIQTSLFQSITLRTAGFATVDVSGVHDATKLMMSVFMFIGGSPGGTAGGIKTVTFAVGVLMVYNIYKGRKEVTLFCRRIPKRVIIRAFVLISISLMIVICGLFVLALVETTSFVNLLFETVSAFATVGLSAAVTPTLTFIGKIVIMILMFIGRIGPITMIISFARKSNAHDNKKGFMYPDGHILIG